MGVRHVSAEQGGANGGGVLNVNCWAGGSCGILASSKFYLFVIIIIIICAFKAKVFLRLFLE